MTHHSRTRDVLPQHDKPICLNGHDAHAQFLIYRPITFTLVACANVTVLVHQVRNLHTRYDNYNTAKDVIATSATTQTLNTAHEYTAGIPEPTNATDALNHRSTWTRPLTHNHYQTQTRMMIMRIDNGHQDADGTQRVCLHRDLQTNGRFDHYGDKTYCSRGEKTVFTTIRRHKNPALRMISQT